MAFVTFSSLSPSLNRFHLSRRSCIQTNARDGLSFPDFRIRRVSAPLCTAVPTPTPGDQPDAILSGSQAPIPGSFQLACEQARSAIDAALATGQQRLFVELNTTNGDETYTTLTTTLPTVRALLQCFSSSSIQVLFPDAGAAALARRDWADGLNPDHSLFGIEEYIPRDADDAIVFVVPRASEVEKMAEIVLNSDDLTIIVVNPDLVDMGVTGLSLNARQLRRDVIDSFDSVFFLRTYPWGVMHRCFPSDWSVWVDDSKQPSGFRCISTTPSRPISDELDRILDEDANTSGTDQGNPLSSAFNKFTRFLKVYMKG